MRILTSQYAEEEIRGKEAELVAAFFKSIKAESSEKETILAIKGKFSKTYSSPKPPPLTRSSSGYDPYYVALRSYL